jgi:ABC-type branched-subunit amino acid transport system permease subunit
MNASALEKLIWVLIYGGLLAVCLGVFVLRRGGDMLGWTLIGAGSASTAGGAVGVYVRSRMGRQAGQQTAGR